MRGPDLLRSLVPGLAAAGLLAAGLACGGPGADDATPPPAQAPAPEAPAPEPDELEVFLAQATPSEIYQRLLDWEGKGRHTDALRLIPRIYDEEAPDDSFRATLEEKRAGLLEAILEEGRFQVGEDEYPTGGLLGVFIHGLAIKVDSLAFQVPVEGDLPPDRYLYLFVADGLPRGDRSGKNLLGRAGPPVDPGRALGSGDPWLVSGALFLARWAGVVDFGPGEVLEAWQARPGSWDETCVEQALLYLASRDPDEVRALPAGNEEVRRALDGLQAPPSRGCLVRPLLVNRADGTVPVDKRVRLALKEYEKAGAKVSAEEKRPWVSSRARDAIFFEEGKREIAAGEWKDGTLALEPGDYSLQSLEGAADPHKLGSPIFGESPIFRCDDGTFLRVSVGLSPE